MKKSLIILGSVILVIIVLFIIKSLNTTSIDNNDYLVKYLEDNNYKKENDLYVKVVTDDGDEIKDASKIDDYDIDVASKKSIEYTTLSIDPKTFNFKRENRTYSDDIEKLYNGSIELKENNIIKFDYMINIYTSQIMLEGSYEITDDYTNSDFKCSLYYQSELEEDVEELETLYCLLAKAETLDFIENINNLTNNKQIYSIIKK